MSLTKIRVKIVEIPLTESGTNMKMHILAVAKVNCEINYHDCQALWRNKKVIKIRAVLLIQRSTQVKCLLAWKHVDW